MRREKNPQVFPLIRYFFAVEKSKSMKFNLITPFSSFLHRNATQRNDKERVSRITHNGKFFFMVGYFGVLPKYLSVTFYYRSLLSLISEIQRKPFFFSIFFENVNYWSLFVSHVRVYENSIAVVYSANISTYIGNICLTYSN